LVVVRLGARTLAVHIPSGTRDPVTSTDRAPPELQRPSLRDLLEVLSLDIRHRNEWLLANLRIIIPPFYRATRDVSCQAVRGVLVLFAFSRSTFFRLRSNPAVSILAAKPPLITHLKDRQLARLCVRIIFARPRLWESWPVAATDNPQQGHLTRSEVVLYFWIESCSRGCDISRSSDALQRAMEAPCIHRSAPSLWPFFVLFQPTLLPR